MIGVLAFGGDPALPFETLSLLQLCRGLLWILIQIVWTDRHPL